MFPADRYSGVAIAGAAGPAIEMVRLFQLQLEHYEKVEGAPLSLEGKANQLGADGPRPTCPAAMQGLAVVPLFAGYDLRRGAGRLFQYDVTGGRYEETDFAATGSGSLHAGTVNKLGLPRGARPRRTPVDLALAALFAGGRRRLRHRRARPASAASTRSSPPSPPTGFTASTTPSCEPLRRLLERSPAPAALTAHLSRHAAPMTHAIRRGGAGHEHARSTSPPNR